MKVDKETLIKHRFWIALGAYALLWLLLLLMLPLMIGSSASAARKVYTDANTAVDNIKSPKVNFSNDAWLSPLKQKEEDLKKRKEKVWQAAWETQKDLMTWPGDNIAPLDRELR